ncbi:GNAT family N-acetyltransferase [Chamaesiphon sp. VAR_48_metabat_135_sub]|uniref:GNAT family N-acetyltransferase n=1 Tax=Chamaesiphon sp. VAR_48_metabat_135_sub TaxID=2964699 RepID=UPI00286B6CC8|nr:GNAT family N-acetyltransferase [Chamaesiphon sp. VAR_48_metabat_135_sub]
MAATNGSKHQTIVRPLQYRDIDAIANLCQQTTITDPAVKVQIEQLLGRMTRWYAPFQFLNIVPTPTFTDRALLVAECEQRVRGIISVSPFNRTRSTWHVEWVSIDSQATTPEQVTGKNDIGSQLLRYCFEHIVEASTWVLEVDVNDNSTLALYRQNGFQPLAHLTYWEISPELLQQLAQREPDLPNLLPVRNTDAQLIYQLDTVSMPPLLRQVFDRQIHDFKNNFVQTVVGKVKEWLQQKQSVSNYVFETQRKAAIGYYRLSLSHDSPGEKLHQRQLLGENTPQTHQAELTVHPAYTWLYPELMSQLARSCQYLPSQPLRLVSADYQPEREEYFQQIGAVRIEHSMLMSRSVWHKLREAKHLSLENLQIAEMLQSLQPSRQPLPNRIEKNDSEDIS